MKKVGQHQGYSNRAIVRKIGCLPSTVANELRHGIPPRNSNKSRKTGCSTRRGKAVYKATGKLSRKWHRISCCTRFLCWVARQFKEHKWSLDAYVGYARRHRLFPVDEMVCSHTLWAGNLNLSVTGMPEAMKRKCHNGLFRAFVPKRVSTESFFPEYILSVADELNEHPRKKPGYRTTEELFERFLDAD